MNGIAIKPAVLSGQIEVLIVFNNPVQQTPTELLGKHSDNNAAPRLRAYWQALDQGAEPNRDVKLILVGNGCVGKTTLAYGLRHRRPPLEPIAERTRHTDEWHQFDIGKHVALPRDGKPLSQWDDPDAFWASVQEGIRRQVEAIIARKTP